MIYRFSQDSQDSQNKTQWGDKKDDSPRTEEEEEDKEQEKEAETS